MYTAPNQTTLRLTKTCFAKLSCLNKRQNRAWLMLYDTVLLFWTSSITYFLRKHNLSVGGFPFSGKEAPILVYPLDQAVLSHCITKSSCLNKRQNRAWLTLTDKIFLFWTSSRISFFKEAHFSRWLSIFRQRSKYPGVPLRLVGRDSSVSIVTRYSPGGEIYHTCPNRPWGPPSLLYNGYQVFPRGKAAGAWHWPPTLI